MKVIIDQKMSGTGSIHDIASKQFDRVIEGRGTFAVVLAAYYGGKGYTTHLTEQAAMAQARKVQKQGYSHQIIDAEGNIMQECNGELFCIKYVDELELIAEGLANGKRPQSKTFVRLPHEQGHKETTRRTGGTSEATGTRRG